MENEYKPVSLQELNDKGFLPKNYEELMKHKNKTKIKKVKPITHLEDELFEQIKKAWLVIPEKEYEAIPGRKLRWDFAWPKQKLLVEVQGGIWLNKSAHSGGTAIERDAEKLCLAQIDGWKCLNITEKQIRNGNAIEWIKKLLM